jgi:D-aspartate ligase
MNINLNRIPVIVLRGVESASHGALGILRSLGRLGVPVYVVAPHAQTAAFFSRYCRGRYVCDVANKEESIRLLLDISRTIGRRSILIPTDDNALLFCADHEQIFRKEFLFPDMCPRLIRGLSSKKGMYHLAREHGVPTPEAVFPRSRQDVLDFISRAKFPVILKAIFGSELKKVTGQKMFIIRSESELLQRYDSVEDLRNPNLMIQEYIPGGDDSVWMFNGYFNGESRCLASFTGRKIRQYPVAQGSTSLGMCVDNQRVREITVEFMRKVAYKGILDIGYRYDARDNTYKLLDVNPRVGSSFRLFTAANGLDVVRAMYLDLTGQSVDPASAREGRKWLVEDQDVVSSLQYFRQGQLTLKQWIHSFHGIEEGAFYSSDDLYPCIVRIATLCGEAWKRRQARSHASSAKSVSTQLAGNQIG